ncbi:TetR/AcrR family transcriptional regulator [Novosphingobium cyanobacteriorum]|uniref:HTH tetR-type domain-containing protein n=1 Tax=Novosphingobium cyanobacteriorum TaxID=3024215 RepID=A0ABT6CL71_9SPHN|nr:hypothetical protein [Novosphingobium cyanobacteriorum]MDF8334313.1 hypothetical protein [Novosphingobium cyanobacteriorum]
MAVDADTLDLRQSRSRDALHAALERLLETTRLQDITVSEIAREAGVGRPVFYRLYDDVSGLLADRMAIDFDRQFELAEAHWRIHGPSIGVMRAATIYSLEAIAARPKLYAALLDGSGGTNAVTIFRAQISRLITLLPAPSDNARRAPEPLRIALIASAISGFLLAWIEAGLQPSIETAAPMMEGLLQSAW